MRDYKVVRRKGANPSLLTDEQIMAYRTVYQDYLIRWHRDHFYDKQAKIEVCLMDAVASKLTYYLAERFFAQLPSFYESHKAGAMELLETEQHRAMLEQLDILPMFRDIAKNLLRDGHTLWEPAINDEGDFDWEVYGDWECPPSRWFRFGPAYPEPNRIKYYLVNYIPRCSQGEFTNLHSIRKTYQANEIYHFTLGSWNEGYGWSYVLRAWDSITKLRYASNADQFLRDVRFLIMVPETWKKARIDRFVDTVDNWSHTRALIYKAEQDPQRKPTGLPAFGMQNLMMQGGTSSGQGGTFQKSTTGETLQDPEYGRLFISTGFGKTWYIKAEAGTLAGSEVNFTDDLLAEMQVFKLMEPIFIKIIKIVLEPLITSGQLEPLPERFVLKFWKEVEILEKQAVLVAQQQMAMSQEATEGHEEEQQEQRENEYSEAYNGWVNALVITTIRLNSSMPITPVMSSWIKDIAVQDNRLYMGIQKPTSIGTSVYKYEIGDPEEAFQMYMDWTDSGSKGGYWWDYIKDSGFDSSTGRLTRYPHTIPRGYGAGLDITKGTQEYKMFGEPIKEPRLIAPGTTREPFKIKQPTWSEQMGKMFAEARAKPRPAPEVNIPTGLPEGMAPYNPTLPKKARIRQESPFSFSRKRFNEFAKDTINHTFGNNTIDLFKKLWESWETNLQYQGVRRINSTASGNGLAFTPLYYIEDNQVIEEYPCLEDYRKINIGKTVPLEVYHNEEKYVVGTYTLKGWDETKDLPIADLEYDEELIRNALYELGKQDSRIAKKLDAGMVPDISEEYDCRIDPKFFSESLNREIRLQRDIELIRVAFVDYGNCSDNICKFEIRENEGGEK